jgi:hypothetical protein
MRCVQRRLTVHQFGEEALRFRFPVTVPVRSFDGLDLGDRGKGEIDPVEGEVPADLL